MAYGQPTKTVSSFAISARSFAVSLPSLFSVSDAREMDSVSLPILVSFLSFPPFFTAAAEAEVLFRSQVDRRYKAKSNFEHE